MKRISKIERKNIAIEMRAAKSMEDLVRVLVLLQSYVEEGVALSERKTISLKTLNFLLYSKNGGEYRAFDISKKNGGIRHIIAPNKQLKYVQWLLNHCLHALYYPMPQAHGFIPKRSIVTNAIPHCGKKFVYNIDLKDFFPSISFHRVHAVLHKVKQIDIHPKVSNIVANLCCYNGVLPQGAPTSPTLSNFVCIRLDRKLYELSKNNNFTVTRYADDITISSNQNIFTDPFKEQVERLISDEGFQLNSSKERLQKYNVIEDGVLVRQHQKVTGIVVNSKPNVNKKYLRNLEAALSNWKNYGYSISQLLHEHFYKFSKGFTRNNGVIPPMEDVLMGRIEYIGMVRGKDDPKYQKLRANYNTLIVKNKRFVSNEYNDVLRTWENKGINEAVKLFYDKRNLN